MNIDDGSKSLNMKTVLNREQVDEFRNILNSISALIKENNESDCILIALMIKDLIFSILILVSENISAHEKYYLEKASSHLYFYSVHYFSGPYPKDFIKCLDFIEYAIYPNPWPRVGMPESVVSRIQNLTHKELIDFIELLRIEYVNVDNL